MTVLEINRFTVSQELVAAEYGRASKVDLCHEN